MLHALLITAAVAAPPSHVRGVSGIGVYHWGMTVEQVLAADKRAPAHRSQGQVGSLRVLAATTAQMRARTDPLEEEFLFDAQGTLRGVTFTHPPATAERELAECAELQRHFTNLWRAPAHQEQSADHAKWELGWELGGSQAAMSCSQLDGKRLMSAALYERGRRP